MAVVLIVEDEPRIADLIDRTLRRHGHETLLAATGHEALDIANRSDPALIILDLGLPDLDGTAVARRLRLHSDVPILMLTARAAERDRIDGLQAGADDYVVKPFSPAELALRVDAILRRGRRDPADEVLRFDDGRLVIDLSARRVTLIDDDGSTRDVSLTPTEWQLLAAFAGRPGRVWSRAELIARARGFDFDGDERTIDSHIKNLRRKLVRGGSSGAIETVTSAGYRFSRSRDVTPDA